MKRIEVLTFSVLVLMLCIGCSSNDPVDTTTGGGNEGEEQMPEELEVVGTTETFDASNVSDDLLLVNDASGNRVYLMNKDAEVVFEWPLSNNIGNDAYLLPNGQLLAILESDTPQITFGGKGGQIQLIDKNGDIDFLFEHNSEDYITHHDIEILPNGNILALVWEKVSADTATEHGVTLGLDIYPEAIIEVNPNTGQIVWEWHAFDHIIQDEDDTKLNFGVIADHPELINVNYYPLDNGDIMHANGLSYDANKDVIYVSMNWYHEVWVIDHSTTTAEAKTNTGGNYGKGGNLIYRFGNPKAYGNLQGERRFYNNHFPNPETGNPNSMLIYVNGNPSGPSTVYELQLPDTFSLMPDQDNEPTVSWSYSDPDMYSSKVSGAVRLANGNTLITEGDFGVWEVSPAGDVVWKLTHTDNENTFLWRTYAYDKDAPEIQSLGIE